MSELKNCPFCGGEAQWAAFPLDYPTSNSRQYVNCKKCDAEINEDSRVNNAKESLSNVIAAWNRRADDIETC